MRFTSEIDAAVRRLEADGGVPRSAAVTPEVVRRYRRRAEDLRAEAQLALFRRLWRAPRRLFALALAVLAAPGRPAPAPRLQ